MAHHSKKKPRRGEDHMNFPRWDNHMFGNPKRTLLSRTTPHHADASKRASKYKTSKQVARRLQETSEQMLFQPRAEQPTTTNTQAKQKRRSRKVSPEHLKSIQSSQSSQSTSAHSSPSSPPSPTKQSKHSPKRRQLTELSAEQKADLEWDKREQRHTINTLPRSTSGLVRSSRTHASQNYEDYLRSQEERYLTDLKLLREKSAQHHEQLQSQPRKKQKLNTETFPRIVRKATPNSPILKKSPHKFPGGIPQLLLSNYNQSQGFSSARSNASTASNISRTSSNISNFSDGQEPTIRGLVERLCAEDRYDDSNQKLVYGEIVRSECSTTCSSCSSVSRNSSDKVWVKDFKKLDKLVKQKEKQDRRIQKQLNHEYWARRMGRYEEPEEINDKPKEKPTLLRSLSTIIRRFNCAADTERYVM